jgi:hypothetical protein
MNLNLPDKNCKESIQMTFIRQTQNLETMLIDQILPRYDQREYHRIQIRGKQTEVYETVRALDFSDSFLIRTLFRLRGLPATLKSVDDLLQAGFVLVDEHPGQEFVLGLIGKLWAPTAKLEKVNASRYREFNHKGYAKVAWNFAVSNTSHGSVKLSTETRIVCMGDSSRRRFRLYWSLVGPFSGLTRREMLRCAKRNTDSRRDDLELG